MIPFALRRFWRGTQETSMMRKWHHNSYCIDWAVVVILTIFAVITLTYPDFPPVFERDILFGDPDIGYPFRREQIGSNTNMIVAIGTPATFLGMIGILHNNWMIIHHGLLTLGLSSGVTHLVTELLKASVGSLRPDFIARCKWDLIEATCTGKPDSVRAGRQSFPSGHSSSAFAAMTFFSLFLAGSTGALCFSAPPRTNTIRSRALLVLFTLTPLFWATYIAITRIQDNRHRGRDVIAGALIGISMSTIFYHAYWPCPFIAKSVATTGPNLPKHVYTEGDEESQELLISH